MPFLDNDGVTRLTEDYLDIFAPKEELGEGDGTNAGPIYELSAKGHAEQFSTTGKNLLPNNVTSRTTNGVTFTVNADGTITTSGTATAQIVISVGTTDTLAAGTYVISGADGGGPGIYELQSGYNGNTYRDQANSVSITLNEAAQLPVSIIVRNGANMNGKLVSPQLELGSTATAYEPYTGGAPSPSPDYPQEIQVVRGRNLIDVAQKASTTYQGFTYSVGTNNRLIASGTSTANNTDIDFTIDSDTVLKSGETYTLSFEGIFAFSTAFTLFIKGASWMNLGVVNNGKSHITFMPNDDVSLNMVKMRVDVGATTNIDANIQLTLGSTPQPYVPYGHVGMEVRDPDTDELISCTPIPLPSRGWVAGLPDGTADSLQLDGAGKCKWTLPTGEVVLDGSSDENWFTHGTTGHGFRNINTLGIRVDGNVIDNVMSDQYRGGTYDNTASSLWFVDNSVHIYNGSWLCFGTSNASTLDEWKALIASHPVTVLFPLAMPIIEDCGYVEDWPTDISEGATISIPELDALNVKYFIANDSISQYANQWYERTKAVDIADVEDAVGDLASVTANLVTHDQFYVGYDEVNGKKMISIFKRGDI